MVAIHLTFKCYGLQYWPTQWEALRSASDLVYRNQSRQRPHREAMYLAFHRSSCLPPNDSKSVM